MDNDHEATSKSRIHLEGLHLVGQHNTSGSSKYKLSSIKWRENVFICMCLCIHLRVCLPLFVKLIAYGSISSERKC